MKLQASGKLKTNTEKTIIQSMNTITDALFKMKGIIGQIPSVWSSDKQDDDVNVFIKSYEKVFQNTGNYLKVFKDYLNYLDCVYPAYKELHDYYNNKFNKTMS